MNYRIALTVFGALTAAFAASAAHAANPPATFYSSLSAFNAAATTTTLYDFENIAPFNEGTPNPGVLVTPAPGRVTFVVTGGSDTNVYAEDSEAAFGDYQLSDGSSSLLAGNPQDSASTTRINLDNTYTAFAIEYGMSANSTNSYTFALFNGNTQVSTSFDAGSAGGDRFFGATSAIAFDNVRVNAAAIGSRGYVAFDNARTGSAGIAVVPEASTLALVLPALGVLGAAIVRRRK